MIQLRRSDGRASDARLAKKRRRRPRGGRERILRSTAALPALFTILNGLAGFGSIHFATKDALGAATLGNLSIAAWLILVAMVCDMLDGRLARLSRRTSDFGGQLDSLCDIISFGIAPAVLMLRTVIMAMRDNIQRIQFLPDFLLVERIMWCIAAVYVACAVLRLARFNVENEPDESSHMMFKGLPSPGAAATIAAMVLLFTNLTGYEKGWLSSAWLLGTVSITLPVITVIVALLMVSSFSYTHVVNQYVRGKRPFGYLVKLAVIVVAALLHPYITGVIVALSYILTGPVRSAWSRRRMRKAPAAVTPQPPAD